MTNKRLSLEIKKNLIPYELRAHQYFRLDSTTASWLYMIDESMQFWALRDACGSITKTKAEAEWKEDKEPEETVGKTKKGRKEMLTGGNLWLCNLYAFRVGKYAELRSILQLSISDEDWGISLVKWDFGKTIG